MINSKSKILIVAANKGSKVVGIILLGQKNVSTSLIMISQLNALVSDHL